MSRWESWVLAFLAPGHTPQPQEQRQPLSVLGQSRAPAPRGRTASSPPKRFQKAQVTNGVINGACRARAAVPPRAGARKRQGRMLTPPNRTEIILQLF